MENVNSDLIRGNVDTIILRCLNLGDMYGLEICNHIKHASSGTYILKQPTLYSALKRLEGKGYITSYWQDSAIGGRRHYYKLTDSGRKNLPVRKDQWSASKGVIDALVEGTDVPNVESTNVESTAVAKKKSAKQPILPIDDAPPVPAVLPKTVTMGMPINPYNPFIESDNDYLTLPFQIMEKQNNGHQTEKAQAQVPIVASSKKLDTKDDIPPLLKYVMNDSALSAMTDTAPAVPDANAFAKYISPDDYAAITTVSAGLCAKTAKITNYDINIRPFVKHFGDKKRGDFLYIGKLRLFAALVMSLIMIAGIILAHYTLKPSMRDYSPDENFFFVLGYTIAGLYFAYYLVRFIANPQSKKAIQSKASEHFIRLAISLGAIIAIFAINILTGLTNVNSPDYIVFWAVPCILVASVYVEGIIQFLLRKTSFFVA